MNNMWTYIGIFILGLFLGGSIMSIIAISGRHRDD